LQMF